MARSGDHYSPGSWIWWPRARERERQSSPCWGEGEAVVAVPVATQPRGGGLGFYVGRAPACFSSPTMSICCYTDWSMAARWSGDGGTVASISGGEEVMTAPRA
ncbi:hypothetical protein E2562_019824 [Oryza meyeriana var. granulata]|uniref:Uncharacterized protein n=1 Tax=Oryza meyeriana var. granulata TaxID=110450 RepID=A0A6G1DLH0_9ORYZ|nr:hypothetical protein E2562_019824 [Oryza meyeriana var. granulata]